MYHDIVNFIIKVLEAIPVFVLLVGVLGSVVKFIKGELQLTNLKDNVEDKKKIKIYLSSYILLGLEILIAVDIIETIYHRSLDELLQLAAIIVLRTFMSFFLNKEIQEDIKEIHL